MEASTMTNPALISVKASLTRITPLGGGKVGLLLPCFLPPLGFRCDLVGELSVLLDVRLVFLGGLLSGSYHSLLPQIDHVQGVTAYLCPPVQLRPSCQH